MAIVRLTQARVGALRPKKRAYELRDKDLKGFGIRVLPSGEMRYFVHGQHERRRLWMMVGHAPAMGLDEARSRARALLGATRAGAIGSQDISNPLFETVSEEVFRRFARHWKPGTFEMNRHYLRKHVLPYFTGRPIAEITREDVARWFRALHATPGAANRAIPVLSVIMREAELLDYRSEDTNPCRGIQRYRRPHRERFLSEQEIGRVGTVLKQYETTHPLYAAAIGLLLLTGCRKSEIATLHWSYLREGNLYLPDSKTGPRTVWLCRNALQILDHLPRKGRWIFPSPRRSRKPISNNVLNRFWSQVCAEACVPEVRLHDLRHSYASIALKLGESVLTIGRLLGHTAPSTTLKYTHVDDQTVRSAVEAINNAFVEG